MREAGVGRKRVAELLEIPREEIAIYASVLSWIGLQLATLGWERARDGSVIVFSTGNHPSRLLASHPLQVRAGDNQLIPLFVTMTDRELFGTRR